MRILFFTILAVMAFPPALYAAEENAGAPAAQQDQGDLEKRVELAKKWHALMPVSVREQINGAIDEAARTQPENEQEVFRANMRNILNYQALEKISVDAMAEIYTTAELQALIDYYSKPEARSAHDKYQMYAEKVYPEISRMLDQAMMRARTGGSQ